ncbi:MAG: hypothetical protein ACQETL_17365 [Bacteroidota bacterium]
MKEYEEHLSGTINWLQTSIENGNGGSCAYFRIPDGWSKDYPETTGYIIPTLINYGYSTDKKRYIKQAERLGQWLLTIQDENGYWNGGIHPPSESNPSVFNTAQILLGLCALYDVTDEEKWLENADQGAIWLAKGINQEGVWEEGNYTDFNPSYYTRVAWPMLLTAMKSNNKVVKEASVKVLDRIKQDKLENGIFKAWGFFEDKPAFTHTMAYTLRGYIESAFLLDDWIQYGTVVESALDKIYHLAELNNGRLAGAYDNKWNPVNYYSCLTGNVQMAICLMKWYQYKGDLRLLNAASKLIEYVNSTQRLNHLFRSLRGAVAGSKPILGRYMIGRYPNWAAKFHADALMLFLKLSDKKEKEWSTAEL